MFNREISNTTFTTDIADELFKNITGNKFRNDDSFLTTMRALLYKRMREDERIRLTFTQSDYTTAQLSNGTQREAIVAMLGTRINPTDESNQLLIHSLNNTDYENNSAVLEFIRANFNKVYGDDYVRAEDLSLFVKKLVDADFYINEKLRTTVIVVCNLNLKILHMVQSLLPRLLPWYFKDDNQLTDEEKPILYALTKRVSVDYLTLIEQFAKNIDFRTAKIKKMLSGFENIADKQRLKSLSHKLDEVNRLLRDLEIRYSAALRDKDGILTSQMGLQERMSQAKESEIMEYFLCNSSLHIQGVSEASIEFVVETYIDSYDPDMFEKIINNKGSVAYCETNSKFQEDDVKELLVGLFGDEAKLKLKSCAAYRFNLLEMYAEGLRDYGFPPAFADYLPNMHIQEYGCLGNNSQYINKCLANNDYILAIEQCVASARNFNMADIAVAEKFIQAIFSPSARKIIMLPDGTSCTPIKALEWLRENNKEVEKDG